MGKREELIDQFLVAYNLDSWKGISELAQKIVREGSEATEPLLKIARDPLQEVAVRKMALEMIAEIQDEDAIPGLEAMLKGKQRMRGMTLGRIEDEGAKKFYGIDTEEYIQGESALTLGKIKSPTARDGLKVALNHHSNYVRECAVDGIKRLNDPSMLVELKENKDRMLRGSILPTLASPRDRKLPIEDIGEFEEYVNWGEIEPGDAIHRYMGVWKLESLGHAGIYIGCKKGENQTRCENHRIIEMGFRYCVVDTLYNFCHPSVLITSKPTRDSFWGFRRHRDITPQARKIIFKRAKEMVQKQARFSFFFSGYKAPNIPSFRCDGFVEWCYEEALGGEGIVNDTAWDKLSPSLQACSPKFSKVADCPFDRQCFNKG